LSIIITTVSDKRCHPTGGATSQLVAANSCVPGILNNCILGRFGIVEEDTLLLQYVRGLASRRVISECATHRTLTGCTRSSYQVRRLDLFGSATPDDIDPSRSDVDFLVGFEPGSTLNAQEQYFGLKEELEALLDRPVDLLVASAVKNPYIRKSIEETRENLYAA
jgi:predicted nucleotidyltransferase